MKTIQAAQDELRISAPTLRKWLTALKITPKGYAHDGRVRLLDDDQIQRIAAALQEREQIISSHARASAVMIKRPGRVTSARNTDARLESNVSAKLVQLPGDLVTLESFCHLHGIAPQTAKKGMYSGRLPVTQGHWKIGRATARYALSAEGRKIFYALWAHLPTFHSCADCPHTPGV